MRLTDLTGNAKEFGAGSTFVLPACFEGTWKTLEAVKKTYEIWEANKMKKNRCSASQYL